jgi:hypothetical protein
LEVVNQFLFFYYNNHLRSSKSTISGLQKLPFLAKYNKLSHVRGMPNNDNYFRFLLFFLKKYEKFLHFLYFILFEYGLSYFPIISLDEKALLILMSVYSKIGTPNIVIQIP